LADLAVDQALALVKINRAYRALDSCVKTAIVGHMGSPQAQLVKMGVDSIWPALAVDQALAEVMTMGVDLTWPALAVDQA